jgi:GNAT superfamily N-acetyltransferase
VTQPVDAMCVREATADDIATIVRLINGAFAVERFFVDQDRIDAAEVSRLLGVGRFLILDQARAPVGCVYVELRGARGYFGLLAVEPGRQGGGIGRRLVAAAEETCRAAGCSALDIQVVNLRTELPPIYRRLGYAECGTRPFPASLPTKLPCHFVLMTKPLV